MLEALWEIVRHDPFVQLSIAFGLGVWIALFLDWREQRG